MKTIILDPAHGVETPGKRSPCGFHREYLWSRNRLHKIAAGLRANGVKVVWSHNGDNEPGLDVRKQRMNNIPAPAFVFSLHNNAAGRVESGEGRVESGEWRVGSGEGRVESGEGRVERGWNNARGAEIYTTIGQTASDAFATKIYEKLKTAIPEVNWRTDYFRDGDPDKEANFTVLMSKHPSVLLEWLFMDNKEDLALLQNAQINRRLEKALIEVLTEIANE